MQKISRRSPNSPCHNQRLELGERGGGGVGKEEEEEKEGSDYGYGVWPSKVTRGRWELPGGRYPPNITVFFTNSRIFL